MVSTYEKRWMKWVAGVGALALLLAAAVWFMRPVAPERVEPPAQAEAGPPEPPVPAEALPDAASGGSPSRVVYRVEQDVRFTVDIAKMMAGVDRAADSKVTADSPRTEVVSRLSGLLEWHAVPGRAERLVRLRWKDTGSRALYPGSPLTAEEREQLGAQVARLLDGAEAYVVVDARQRMTQVRVSPTLSPQARPLLLNVLEMVAVTLPRSPPAEWNAQERDSFGRYNGTYQVEAREGQQLLVSKQKHYQEITSVMSGPRQAVGLEEKHVRNLGKARLRFSLEEQRLLSAEGHFRTRIRHPLADADVEERYSVKPAAAEVLAALAPPSGAALEQHLTGLVELDPQAVLEQARAPVAVTRPGLTGLTPEAHQRKLREVVAAMRRAPHFDPHAEESKPLLDELNMLLATEPERARHTLRETLADASEPVRGEVLAAVVSEALPHGAAGQGLAADVLATPGLAQEGYAAALAGLGTQDKLETSGRNALMRVLRGELTTVPPDIASNAPLLVGYQGRVAQESGGDAATWFDALMAELSQAKDPQRQELVLLGLGNIGDARTLALAEPYLASPHANVRLAAASALRQVADPGALGRIFTVFLSDPSVEVRMGIADLFSEVGPLEAVLANAQAAMAGQPDASVRKRTLVVLAQRSRSHDFVSRFLTDPDPSIREMAQEFLGQL